MEVNSAELYTLRMNLNLEAPLKGMCHLEEWEMIIKTDLQQASAQLLNIMIVHYSTILALNNKIEDFGKEDRCYIIISVVCIWDTLGQIAFYQYKSRKPL